MSSVLPPELDASTLIRKIADGEIGRDFILLAAQAFLPIPQEDLVAVLSHLSVHPDTEIADHAKRSLSDLPTRVILSFAQDQKASEAHLSSLARATKDPVILEALLRNRSMNDETIDWLAAHASPSLQEVIVINQERILRYPQILDSLLQNPEVTADVRRRVLETKEEFFEKRQRAELHSQALADAELDIALDADESAIADLLEKAKEMEGLDSEIPPFISEDEKTMSLFNKIVAMSVAEKVKLAYKGGKSERNILIRERNRLVCAAVIRNPRVSDTEAEAYAGMRNVEDDVLRMIGTNREWMSKYPIVQALVRNPKAPIAVVLPLINRLTLRDLKNLGIDKNVPDVIRATAKRVLVNKRG